MSDQPPGSSGTPPPPPPPSSGGPPWYGAPLPVSHNGATTSLVIGVASIVVTVIGTCLCGFLGGIGALVGPFGIWQAQRARREIDAAAGHYDNRGQAVAGLICSIVGTVLGALVLLASIAVIAVIGFGAVDGMTY